jgi:hypothetical protein
MKGNNDMLSSSLPSLISLHILSRNAPKCSQLLMCSQSCLYYIIHFNNKWSSEKSRSLPVVLLRNMVPIRSFHGSWYRLSCTRLNGDFGGVHFISRCSSGRGINRPLTKYLLSVADSSVGLKSASDSKKIYNN